MNKKAFTSPSRGMSKSESRTTTSKNDAFRFSCERYRLTRERIDNLNKKCAFTLAEVLITLGIIGIVAAMTLPGLIQNYQAKVRQNQFKKAYSTFFNAIKQAQANIGSPVAFYYWTSGTTCTAVCKEREPVYNDCIRYECLETGRPLPPDLNGPALDAAMFEEELFTKTLKVAKFCRNNSLANGCLTKDYRGIDKVKAEQNPDAPPLNPNSSFGDSNIKNNFSSWLLVDGTLIIKHGQYKRNAPLYTIDINGHKGPNKWGYDIFTFQLFGNAANGITELRPITYAIEKGGMSTDQMLKNMYK